ncbi:MAG: UDP-diphospho-muramoylpentapeptide beta-N-acetylglucosaminyltransferase [Oscillospiraceae bacterium]|nr:UDP-diphospho-muramoylpentapeptide beta-N-acetylglucosaminyltransferase [Oscillospiraceae bacterium]MDE6841541.1 UDP-diphospho-muramoylpentapeptide beta-N-acetylglucosaminyltransferase [Oscillospiraceae bacterium]
MNILILTGKFGMGHLSAARALQEQLSLDGHRAEVVDLFEYALPERAGAMYWWFNVLVTYGGVFYNLYHDLTANDSGDGRGDDLLDGLDRLLDEYGPDVVVSTHPICSAAMARYKLEGPSDIPLVTCVTDVTCHSEWLHPGTDCYMVAEESVRQGFIAKGADPDTVVVSGIPVSGRFQPARKDHSQRRELLIMGGGLGLMPRRDSFYQALNALPGVHTTILTGRNDKLFQRLNGKYENIEAVPFTTQVDKYMARAHLMLSKPGGITCFEAIAARLPILAWQPFLKQEQENANFLVRRGMARIAAKEESACLAAIRETIGDARMLDSMEAAMDDMAASLTRRAVCAVVQALAAESRVSA